MFGFLRKKNKPASSLPVDPLAAYDAVIDSFERQATEVRKSAATLLALRGELNRELEKYAKRLESLAARLSAAKDDVKIEKVLQRDREEALAMKLQTDAALEGAKRDAAMLLSAAEDLAAKVTSLKAERVSAKARFAAGHTLSEGLRAQVEEFDRVVKLDAARDEVEKAHALADLYRDEAKNK